MPEAPADPVLHNHERRLANLEEATLVMSRLQADMARTMAEVREATELHTRWLVEHEKLLVEHERWLVEHEKWSSAFDAKLDRLEALITKGHGGNGNV